MSLNYSSKKKKRKKETHRDSRVLTEMREVFRQFPYASQIQTRIGIWTDKGRMSSDPGQLDQSLEVGLSQCHFEWQP